MWLKVEADAADDWRVQDLADELGISHGDAFEALFRVWGQLYKRGGGPMSPREVDGAARRKGVAEALIKCQLAEASLEGIRVKGDRRVEELQHYRNKQSNNAKKRKPVDNSSAKTQPNASQSAAMAEPVTLLSSSLFSLSSPDPEKKPEKTISTRAKGEHQQWVDAWDGLYRECTGQSYGWEDKRQFRLAKELLATYGLEQCMSRAQVLLSSACPDWLAKGGRDLATLKQHWNKLAPQAQRAWKPEDLAKWAEEQMARERSGT